MEYEKLEDRSITLKMYFCHGTYISFQMLLFTSIWDKISKQKTKLTPGEYSLNTIGEKSIHMHEYLIVVS